MKKTIEVTEDGRMSRLFYEDEKMTPTVLEILRENGYAIAAPCGGNGTCGKCTVAYETGGLWKKERACRLEASDGMRIRLEKAAGGGVILTQSLSDEEEKERTDGLGAGAPRSAAAADLGTTTVVVTLLDAAEGRVLDTASDWNAQAPYGADVISRIGYAMKGESEEKELTDCLHRQILSMLEILCDHAGIGIDRIEALYVTGNTIMQHFCAGLSARSIAQAPFTPLSLFDDARSGCQDAAPGQQNDAVPGRWIGKLPVRYAPCVSGYVGGDALAGLWASGAAEAEGPFVYLDIGTNTEIFLGSLDPDGKRIFRSCSAASGPAFEGALLSCGMTAVEGAISHVHWDGQRPVIECIGTASTARGLCGSGVLDALAMLLDLGIVDETGRLLPPEEAEGDFGEWLAADEQDNGCFYLTEDHRVYVSAADIRQLQLAKSAIAAGVRVLCEEAGIEAVQLKEIWLAGGFGTYLDPESARRIGLLPAGEAKIVSCGNASLLGAVKMAFDPKAATELLDLKEQCRYLELSAHARFSELFMDEMFFE